MNAAVHTGEFELLTACARWPLLPEDSEEISRLAAGTIDWSVFLDMTLLHRLGPLVYHNLTAIAQVPATIRAELEQDTRVSGMAIFQSVAEMLRLTRALAGVDVRILKGVPLAILAYGDAGLRHVGDIDLLIDVADVDVCDRLLRECGYKLIEPWVKLTPRRRAYYIAHWKDFIYEHRESGQSVELHWRLTRNAALPLTALRSRNSTCNTPFGDGGVSTLTPDNLALYLCVHGALDGWIRLKALADIAAIFRFMEAQQFERILERAHAVGLVPELSAALLLAQQIFRIPMPVGGLLPADAPVVRDILKFSLHAITANDYRLPREDITGRQWVAYELQLRRSWRYRWEVLQRTLFKTRVWHTIDLPDALFPLYALLSPIEWVGFHISRALLNVRR